MCVYICVLVEENREVHLSQNTIQIASIKSKHSDEVDLLTR